MSRPPRLPKDRRLGRVAFLATAVIAGLWLYVPRAEAGPIHVNCDAGGNLQHKIDVAPGGSTILVQGTCDGPFSIDGKGLTLKGDPTATIDGQHAGSTLTFDAGGKTLHLTDLRVTGGVAPGQGGGVNVLHGSLTLLRTTVTGNRAVGDDYSYGGGIAILGVDAGDLSITASRITNNRALTEPSSGFAYAQGGGIVAMGTVTISHSTISANVARATSADSYAYAYGGAIQSGPITVAGSTIANNVARASAPTTYAYAYGGALQVGPLDLTGSTISGNHVIAHSGTSYAYTYGGAMDIGSGTISGSTVKQNTTDSHGELYAYSYGGGIFSEGGALSLEHSSVLFNGVSARSNGSYAYVYGGGISSGGDVVHLQRSTVGGNDGSVISDIDNAFGYGGGVSAEALQAINSTVASNTLSASSQTGAAKTGAAYGGGVFVDDGATLTNVTVASNTAAASGDTFTSQGGGLYATDLTTKASILAQNHGTTGIDCNATTTSKGFNLVQHPGKCLTTPKPSDVTGQGAQLGSLQNNGGPTLTMAIAATSPAFNAIPGALCAVPFDQRGVPRPQGPRCDIGAFERKVP